MHSFHDYEFTLEMTLEYMQLTVSKFYGGVG
jgi:hypothetical protein